jgi:hypothetical protein
MDMDTDFIKLKQSIVKETVKKIKQYFVITDTDGEVIKESTMLDIILKNETAKCSGIIQNSTGKILQCSKKSIGTTQYCKIHAALRKNININTQNIIEVSSVYEEPISINKFKKTFIENSFYYIDIVNSFIYTNEGIKAGITEYNDETGELVNVLTNNPYILGQL